MARITVEDCLENVDNRFALIHLTARRVRQLRKGMEPLVICKNRDIVVTLREIAAKKVFPVKDQDSNDLIEDKDGSTLKELTETTSDVLQSLEQESKEAISKG